MLVGSATGELVGTTFEAHDRVLPARKLWIAFAAEAVGTVRVDAGAQAALTTRPNSLLPAGVIGSSGPFVVGDVVDVVGPDETVFARGITAVDAKALETVLGRRSEDLPVGMSTTVVHRDDLVVLDESVAGAVR